MGNHTAFFYGTLMHPKVLKAVINSDGSHLQLCPAVLFNYTRHEVMYNDYPGILPLEKGSKILDRELTREESSVRGTLVTGLTSEDMDALNKFEGEEYIRRKVEVYPIGPFIDVATHPIDDDALLPQHPPPLPEPSRLPEPSTADTYVYLDYTNLKPELWSFEDFVKNNAWKWYGGTR